FHYHFPRPVPVLRVVLDDGDVISQPSENIGIRQLLLIELCELEKACDIVADLRSCQAFAGSVDRRFVWDPDHLHLHRVKISVTIPARLANLKTLDIASEVTKTKKHDIRRCFQCVTRLCPRECLGIDPMDDMYLLNTRSKLVRARYTAVRTA